MKINNCKLRKIIFKFYNFHLLLKILYHNMLIDNLSIPLYDDNQCTNFKKAHNSLYHRNMVNYYVEKVNKNIDQFNKKDKHCQFIKYKL